MSSTGPVAKPFPAGIIFPSPSITPALSVARRRVIWPRVTLPSRRESLNDICFESDHICSKADDVERASETSLVCASQNGGGDVFVHCPSR